MSGSPSYGGYISSLLLLLGKLSYHILNSMGITHLPVPSAEPAPHCVLGGTYVLSDLTMPIFSPEHAINAEFVAAPKGVSENFKADGPFYSVLAVVRLVISTNYSDTSSVKYSDATASLVAALLSTGVIHIEVIAREACHDIDGDDVPFLYLVQCAKDDLLSGLDLHSEPANRRQVSNWVSRAIFFLYYTRAYLLPRVTVHFCFRSRRFRTHCTGSLRTTRTPKKLLRQAPRRYLAQMRRLPVDRWTRWSRQSCEIWASSTSSKLFSASLVQLNGHAAAPPAFLASIVRTLQEDARRRR